jgi:tetratricopeptide (TPR) repeat protein
MKTKVLLFLIATAVAAAAGESKKLHGPLLDGLDGVHHPVTTTSKLAQRYFDQGLVLSFAFNHKEAVRSFRSAAQLDPACAMAHWGVAYASGPHVNRPMDHEDNARAWEAVQQALALKDQATPGERALIGAMAARYTPKLPEDRAALDRAYADALRGVVKAFPDDLTAQTLFAEALMNLMPWDYWTGNRVHKPEIAEALTALRFVMARDPDHPGANHLFIHAVEAGPNPESALPAADRLAKSGPEAGHLIHMPAHVYMRVGQYHDAVEANVRAIKADRKYIRQCRAQGFYPGMYYPHNMHFLWWAQAFEGRSRDALRSANEAAQFANDNSCGPIKVLEAPRLRHLPWLTMARFGRWDDLLRIEQPARTNDFLVDRALWHFTRGLAFAAKRDTAAAEREQAQLDAIVDSQELAKLDSPAFPVSATLVVAKHWLAGRVAGAKGDPRAMIAQLEQAVAAEDKLPYMEPTYWPFPVRPTLGAALLEAGEYARAEQIFREDLAYWQRNGWSLLGLERSLRAQGKTASADRVRKEFERAWQHSDVELDLAWY